MHTCLRLVILAVALQLCLAGPVLVPSRMAALQPNTPENIYKLQHLGPKDRPEYLSGQFEGDIVLTQEQLDYINEVQINPNTVYIDPTRHWPDGVVPYEFGATYSADDLAMIDLALYNLEHFTCLRFVKRTTEEDYIYIENPGGVCSSMVGRVGGRQLMNLSSPGCVTFTTVIHEFMHALGFFHMQSATDRDDFVRILWQNIEPGMEHNFEKYPSTLISQFGVPYDFTSVMHYDADEFSVNGLPTIEAITNNVIRPTDTWSWWDIERINNAFCKTKKNL